MILLMIHQHSDVLGIETSRKTSESFKPIPYFQMSSKSLYLSAGRYNDTLGAIAEGGSDRIVRRYSLVSHITVIITVTITTAITIKYLRFIWIRDQTQTNLQFCVQNIILSSPLRLYRDTSHRPASQPTLPVQS